MGTADVTTICHYCRLREATHETPLYRIPACAECSDTRGREDDNALSAALSREGTRGMANDGLVRDCEIDAESEEPRPLEGWVDLEAHPPSESDGGEATESFPAWVECPHGCTEDYYCTIHNTHTDDCSCPPIEEWAFDPFTSGGRPIPPEHMAETPESGDE